MQRLIAASASLRDIRNAPILLLIALTLSVMVVLPLRLPALLGEGGADHALHALAKPSAPGLAQTLHATISDSSILGQASGTEAQRFQDMTPQAAAAYNAARPISLLPLLPARTFQLAGADDEDRARAQQCLAMAVYYEAGFESARGEAAVAQVVLNRLRHPIFPKTVCGVVFQGADLPTGCQFTFTCDGSIARPPEPAAWARAQGVAERALAGYVEPSVGTATHYHTQWVAPYWAPSLVKLTQIGAHIFYRWGGGVGLPGAFNGRYAGGEPLTPNAPLPLPASIAAPEAPQPIALVKSPEVQTLETVAIQPTTTVEPARLTPAPTTVLADMRISGVVVARAPAPAILAQTPGMSGDPSRRGW